MYNYPPSTMSNKTKCRGDQTGRPYIRRLMNTIFMNLFLSK